jgi:GNAT superfamily N-acetyltransferase
MMNALSAQFAEVRSAATHRPDRHPARDARPIVLGGRAAIVRPVLPQDAGLLRDFVSRLSPQSRYRRFHGAMSTLPEATLRYLTDVDQHDHVALLVETADRRPERRQVAEARFVRREAPAERLRADIAIAVADDWQRSGLGAFLLRTLAHRAGNAGLASLHADLLADNEPMRRLLERLGWRVGRDPVDPLLAAATLPLQYDSRSEAREPIRCISSCSSQGSPRWRSEPNCWCAAEAAWPAPSASPRWSSA